MKSNKILVVVLFIGLVLFSGCITQDSVQKTVAPGVTVPPQTTPSTNIAGTISKVGDTVTVNYIGMLEDGTIFDTSDNSVALDPSAPKIGGFMVRDSYESLTFKIGAGEVIAGFEEAVLGMRVGEVKESTISPEKGYGPMTEDMITYSPRSFTISRLEDITNAGFHAKLGLDPVIGEQIYLTDLYWGDNIRRWDNATVHDIDWKKAMVTLRHDPVQGSIVQTSIGIIQVSVDDDSITQTLTPEIDKVIRTNSGDIVTVLSYDDEQIKIGHSLAGKILVFKVKLEKIS